MFRHELALVTRNWFARSRMLVSGGAVVPDRVRNNPKISRLEVASRTAASTLVEWGRYAKYLGRGLVVVDLGRRVQKVRDAEHSGGDWHRQAAIESAGFAGAIGGGAIGVDLGAAALGAMVMLTPAGWALVVGSVIATGVAVAGSIAFAQVAEGLAAQHYDRVREFQESLR